MSLARRIHVARISRQYKYITNENKMVRIPIRATCIRLAKDIYMIRYFHHKMEIIFLTLFQSKNRIIHANENCSEIKQGYNSYLVYVW